MTGKDTAASASFFGQALDVQAVHKQLSTAKNLEPTTSELWDFYVRTGQEKGATELRAISGYLLEFATGHFGGGRLREV